MPRGVKRQPAQVESPAAKDPYPQHAKMYPFYEQNWAVREFIGFLATAGLVNLTSQQVEDALLAWRGVDKLEYEAEAAKLKSEYRWLWEQHDAALVKPGTMERVVTSAAVKVAQAALPDRSPDDGLLFLLERIRGGRDE